MSILLRAVISQPALLIGEDVGEITHKPFSTPSHTHTDQHRFTKSQINQIATQSCKESVQSSTDNKCEKNMFFMKLSFNYMILLIFRILTFFPIVLIFCCTNYNY